MRRKGGSSLLLRTAATVSAVAITLVAFGSNAATASTAAATINTFPSWNGSDIAQPFGCPDTTTYGETITVPAGKTHLNKFVFTWRNLSTPGTMVVRAEVYAWNGSMATGSSLFQRKRTISFPDQLFHLESFKSRTGISVTPGLQYVLFASIDKDYEQCSNYTLGWGLPFNSDPYPGGQFVFQNNSGNEANWTTVPWNNFGGWDAAFKAFLS
jgi:hypothetical protein